MASKARFRTGVSTQSAIPSLQRTALRILNFYSQRIPHSLLNSIAVLVCPMSQNVCVLLRFMVGTVEIGYRIYIVQFIIQLCAFRCRSPNNNRSFICKLFLWLWFCFIYIFYCFAFLAHYAEY